MKNLTKLSTVMIATIVALLSSVKASQSATIALNPGEWQKFTFPPIGQPAIDTFTFNASPTGAKLYVTDAGSSGDRFTISNNGSSIGNTSSVARGFSCGFSSPEDCFRSSSMSTGNFDLKTSGEQKIEVTTIASAVPRIGGVGYLQAETSFVKLYGDVKSQTDFINILNANSKGVSFYSDSSGSTDFTSLYPKVTDITALNTFGSQIYEVVSGKDDGINNKPQRPVNLKVGYNLEGVVVGAACVNASLAQVVVNEVISDCNGSHNFQAIDLADLQIIGKLTNNSIFDTPSSLITHELTEAMGVASGLSFNTAHGQAITYQDNVLTDEKKGTRDTAIGSRMLPIGVDPQATKIYFDTAYYTKSPTEQQILFPWIDPSGGKGWEILVLTSPNGFDIADIKSGIFDSGIPWSGKDVNITVDSISYVSAELAPTSVPEPFTIVGTLIGGTAAFRMRKKLKAINK